MKYAIISMLIFLLCDINSISIEQGIKWLNEKHPYIEIKEVNLDGVGIKDGKRAIFLRHETKCLPIESKYDLLIICPDDWIKFLGKFKKHKEKEGIKTIIVGLNEIHNNGRDLAEKIKYCIKESIEKLGIKYVLLLGSIDKIPIRYVLYAWESGGKIYKEWLPTDLYYADIYRYENGKIVFSSWDTNGNGIYGESYAGGIGENDIIDLYPDVYLGRLACENKFILKQVIRKIINYDSNGRWFKRIILVGGDTFPNWGILEGEYMNNYIANIMKEFEPYKIWYSLGNLNTIEIQKALEMGAGFLYYSGHGFPYGWATHPKGSDEWIGEYYTPYIFALFNLYRLPIVFLDACLTAKIDFNLTDLGIPIKHNLPCFAWCFVRCPYGGAIATIGATRVAFTGVDQNGPKWGASYLAYTFFSSYNETKLLGEIFVEAQEKYVNKNPWDKWTVQEFILLGDPTLRIK